MSGRKRPVGKARRTKKRASAPERAAPTPKAPYKVTATDRAMRGLDGINDSTSREHVWKAMKALAEDPRPPGNEKLAPGEHRIRHGDYRVVYIVDDLAREIVVTNVADRKEIYREWRRRR